MIVLRRLAAGLAWLWLAAPLVAQQLPTLTPSEYGRFENLGTFLLDPSGEWLAASIQRVDERNEIRVHATSGRGDALVLEHGTRPVFAEGGRWLAYRKGVSPAEREASKTPIHDRLGLVELNPGRDTVLFEISDVAFRDDGVWLAARGYPLADSVGADLIVLDPASGRRTVIGNVESFAWQPDGVRLAATLRTAGGDGNGVVLFDPDSGTLRTLDSRNARYRGLTWHEDSGALGVLRSVSREDRKDDAHDVLAWTAPSAAPQVLAADHPGLGDTLRVVESAGISFSDDGAIVFVGLRPWEPDPKGKSATEPDDSASTASESTAADPDAPKEADVQVWHWDDDQILRAQEYNAARIARQTYAAAWHLRSDRFVRLGEDLEEPVRMVEGGRWGLVPDYTPYRVQRRWGDSSADWYRVDPGTGERTRIAQGVHWGIEEGPADGRVLVYEDDRWIAVDLTSLERVAIGDAGRFTMPLFDYDYPGPRPPWGVGAWIEGTTTALLYDKHDVWRADLVTGVLTRMTEGAQAGIRYRVAHVDPERRPGEATPWSDTDPLWLSTLDLDTKRSGYARVRPGGSAETLVSEDARVSSLTRARDAARYVLRQERWDDAPDLFVGDEDLRSLRRLTAVNAFQDEYAWGRTELLRYTTDAGHALQAILTYPANFEEGKRYPLILYQYERLSDGLHRYYTPSQRSYYNYQVWSQEGYFVLMPDIAYEPGRPGPSALDAVEHALDAAVATGHVDPERMGLIGHSWGGYQAAYLPTRTNRFAASVAGAAITNFMSFMGAVHWNGGLPESGHWETGQARMAVPYWEDVQGHLESSPANFITNLQTPMLLMHGDADGVVDFRQGLEFYNYARRAGKEVVLLVYPGADHGLREETQQVDYHRRILQWFGHYLKGEPAPEWIQRGETWVERGRRLGH
ncbi:MAG: YqiA/YcfP family alpha/beta fold hydrolase [Gemmatimonadota bacterium]